MSQYQEDYETLVVAEIDGQLQAIAPGLVGSGMGTIDQPKVDGKPRPSRAVIPNEETDGYRWAPWGHNDALPGIIRHKIERVPMAGAAIYRMVQMMYGNGLIYFRNSDLADGPGVRRAYIPKVERWLRLNRINTHYLPQQFTNFRYYFNAFSELIFSRDRRQIVGLFHKEAEFCRLAVQSERTRRVESMYFSGDFALNLNPPSRDIRKILLFDWQDQEGFLNRVRGYKFAWHTAGPAPGYLYYARPPWMGLFKDDGWLDASSRVPEDREKASAVQVADQGDQQQAKRQQECLPVADPDV